MKTIKQITNMKLFEQLTFKQVKKEILYWEQDNENPKSVEVVCIGQEPGSDIYEYGDGTMNEHFFAVVVIDGVKCWKGYEWNCDDEEISSSWDGPVCDKVGYECFMEETDDEGDDELPSNVVERCKYVGQTMDTAGLSHCNVDTAQELKVPVTAVRWNYPFEVEGGGSYNVYPIEPAKTWGELLTRIIEVLQREYAKHEDEMRHAIGDYFIELLEVHPNGLATVCFGS